MQQKSKTTREKAQWKDPGPRCPLNTKPDKRCLENKCQDIFSARLLSHEPVESSATPLLHKWVSLWLGPCQHVPPFRQREGGRTYLDPLWGMSSSTVESLLRTEEEKLVHPLYGEARANFWLPQAPNKIKVLTYYGRFEGFKTTKRQQSPLATSYHCWEMTLYFTNMTKCRDTGQNRLQLQIWA